MTISLSAQSPDKTYAQHLVDEVLKKHPEVVVLAMHVTPPKSSENIIIASNIGRIGKKADEDDLAVINSGVPKLEVNAKGDRFEVELPLQDASARTIGALGVVFPYQTGDDQGKRQKQAEQIRYELRRRITNAGNLLEPYPYDPHYTTYTYAQKLVDEAMAKYPELVILSIHAAPDNGSPSVMIASNIGRIGKKDSEDDLAVVRTGKPFLEVKAPGDRYEDVLVLRDASGKTIGALAVLFPYKAGDDKIRLERQAEKIRDELGKRIPSQAKLFESAR
jgi:hypothetical protein